MSTVVIRFSSLGDIVLAGAVTGSLAESSGPIQFLTLPRWRELAAELPGVETVLCWGQDPLPTHADRIVDLHGSPRSRLASLRIRGPVSRVSRHDLRRRWRTWFKAGAPPPSVVDRYAKAAQVTPAPRPWFATESTTTEGKRDALVLCPGAAWPTKRWDIEGWISLGQRWPGEVLVLGGPEDGSRVRTVENAIGPRAVGISERGFSRTLAALGQGRLAVAGDTGLLHLCAAAGMPVVGLFGPTTSADGFWGQGLAATPGRAVELDLDCRPCSRFGGTTCPIGDHACLDQLTVDQVWHAIQDCLDEAPAWAG